MTMPTRYIEFGYPLANLPLPGHAVDSLDVVNTVEPLLRGTMAIIMALNTAFFRHDITTEEGIAALSLLEGHLETALHILKRWREEECASQDDTPRRKGRTMMDRCDSEEPLRIDFDPSVHLLDAVDAVVAMTMRLRYAEGMAQVCISAMEDPECWDQDLKHALGLLSSYLTALRQGMARWRAGIVHDPNDPVTSA